VTFEEYSERAWACAIYPNDDGVYPFLGLAGEAGEVCELKKKAIRDNEGLVSHDALVKELGDVLWYLNAIAREYAIDLEYIAEVNIEKLESRKQRGVLHGSGDNR